MTASALLRHGPEHAGVLLDGLADWMARKGYSSVNDLRGMLAVPAWTTRLLTSVQGMSWRTPRRQRYPRPVVTSGHRRGRWT